MTKKTKNHARLIALTLFILLLAAGTRMTFKLFPTSHAGIISGCAKAYSLEPAFVFGVIHAESKFKALAASPKGAGGLMQLTEPTACWLAEKMGIEDFTIDQIFDPETNINIGCYNLARLLKKYGGDETLALAAYNAGEGNVSKWLKDPRYSGDEKTLAVIPFKETHQYIRRVNFNTTVYRVLLIVKPYLPNLLTGGSDQ